MAKNNQENILKDKMEVFVLPAIKMYSKGTIFKLEWTEQCIRIEKPTGRASLDPRIYWGTLLARRGKTAILKISSTHCPPPLGSLNFPLRADSFVWRKTTFLDLLVMPR